LAEVERLGLDVPKDIGGLKQLIARQFDIETTIGQLKARVVAQAKERRLPSGAREDHAKTRRELAIPGRIGTATELDAVIHRLDAVRVELPFTEFDIIIEKG
jgi:hypothetical protein